LAFGAIYDYLIGQGLDPMSSEFATYVQLASLAVGGTFGGEAGAAIALSATQNNWLNHREYEEAQQARAACSPSNQEACARYRELEELDRSRNAEFAAYYANAFQEVQIKGVVVDEGWSKNVEQTYWRENLGLFGEPYFLDGSHQAVSKTMGERLYDIFQTPGIRESGGWVNAGLLGVLGDAAAGFQDLLNPGYGKNYFTGESVTGTDAIDARFFGFVDLATLFLGGTVSSAEKGVARAVAGDAATIEGRAVTSAADDALGISNRLLLDNIIGDGMIAHPVKPLAKLPENPSQLGHIFRDAPGHILDTPANRELLISISNNPSNKMGVDRYGLTWYGQTLDNGNQVWVSVRGGVIQNGGVNSVPREFTPGVGMSK
jgi:hypothetical protein